MSKSNVNTSSARDRQQIAIWLLVCCAFIFAMVVLGGITRLTGSGLSIVEWDPVFGILPPLTQAGWEEAFAAYQQSPEFRTVNRDMDLEGFKGIFWLEYLHRLLGRIIGIIFLLPLLFFLIMRKIPVALVPRLTTLFVLGGLQGLLGWYMVKSGLVDNPQVSQYRLTAHLLLAVLVYGYMFWIALGLLEASNTQFKLKSARPDLYRLRAFTYAVVALIVLTMAAGGFVAGLKAGLAYNTFPLMAGHWIPPGIMALEPWPRNLFENVTTVQFNHRLLAFIVLGSVVVLWLTAIRHQLPRQLRYGFHALLFMTLLQIALGISTLLLGVPIPLASAHQGGALMLFTIALFLAHRLRDVTAEAPVTALRIGQTVES